jgi:hypothetical protein
VALRRRLFGGGFYLYQRLYRSTNQGQSWQETGVEYTQSSFSDSRGFYCPTFLQYGKDYQGARDSYVYMYAPELKSSSWEVQKPGEITLMRVPRSGLSSRSQYEYFAGLDGGGSPVWTGDMNGRRPVFQDRENGVMTVSVSYNPGLGRYFLITEHTAGMRGNIGIYDAPEPWGPWTTVLFESGFGTPEIDATTFFWNFSNKWLSADGRDFTLVFTGVSSNDSWNTVRGRFTTGSASTTCPDPHSHAGIHSYPYADSNTHAHANPNCIFDTRANSGHIIYTYTNPGCHCYSNTYPYANPGFFAHTAAG